MYRITILVFTLLCLSLLTFSLNTCLPDGIFCYTDKLRLRLRIGKRFPECCGICVEDVQRLSFDGICMENKAR